MICMHLYLIWNIGPHFFLIFLSFDWWGLATSDLGPLCRSASRLLELTFVSPFQNIYNLHSSSFTGPMMTLSLAGNLINLRRSFNNSLSDCQQHSMSLVEKIKMPFANKNVPLTDCRKFSYLFRSLKGSNPLLSIMLPPCTSYCSKVCSIRDSDTWWFWVTVLSLFFF
jgi:hypothetical protein